MKKIDKPILISRPYMPDMSDFTKEAQSLWDTRWLTHNGPLVSEFEKQVSAKLMVNNAVVYANGHLALDAAIRSLDLTGEVITTPFTYISTSHAISMNGLKIVYCDIKESDGTMDEDKIEALITDKTCAIVPVHVYGFPCNCKKIEEIAKKYNLKVIYDAAHAFGVSVDGKGIGSFGDISMFSFHATKVFHTVEGGLLTFNDSSMKDRLISEKNFGMIAPEEADKISLNAKMTELHAAMGIANLKSIDWQISHRKELLLHYRERFSQIRGIRVFDWDKENVVYNYAYFPIIINEDVAGVSRDVVAEKMEKEYNIFARKYFFPLLSDLICYKNDHDSKDTPIAKKMADSVMTLPLYVDLTHEQIDYIADAVTEIIEGVK